MEKIRIEFNEQDYQIYHNYCLRYYNVYDTTRKRSIHLFLELFEKDMIPVGEHELRVVYEFFSKKCEELPAVNAFPSANDSTAFSQFQICRDMQYLIEDFEKIYRLIEKTGIASNYLLVLATFSRIIEEEKKAYNFTINQRDEEKIRSFAPEIAKIILTRLGLDAGWEPVLYELTHIVRSYNQKFPDQKIDRNCLSLIGPAVVSQFDVAVGTETIQSTLERYFDESELAEFESLLNNTPYLPDNDTDADCRNDFIFNALKSISDKSIDHGYPKTGSDFVLFETADLPAVISPDVISKSSLAFSPFGRSFTQYPHNILEHYSSRFAIDVSDTVTSLAVMPERGDNYSGNAYTKPGVPQYSVMFMGIVIMILLAVTMAAVSGMWNPVKAIDNTSTGIKSNVSNPVIIPKTASLAAKTDPGVSLHSPPVKSEPVNGVEDNKNSSVQSLTTSTTLTSGEINKHFMRVAFGDNTVIKKFPEERIVIAITGDYDDTDIATVNEFIALFNNASTTNKIHEAVKLGDQASIVMTFLPESAIMDIENPADTVISKDPDTGIINFLRKTVKIQFVSKDVLVINSGHQGDQRKHWVLRGLLSELGLMGETNDNAESIFYENSENTTQLSPLDLKALEIMYSKKITPGMTFDRARSLLMV